jgi:hypothetical protein
MRTLLVVAIAVLLAGPALAQGRLKPTKPVQSGPTEQQKKKKNEAMEKAHKSALDKIPDQPKADPWQGVRAAEPAKSPASR